MFEAIKKVLKVDEEKDVAAIVGFLSSAVPATIAKKVIIAYIKEHKTYMFSDVKQEIINMLQS